MQRSSSFFDDEKDLLPNFWNKVPCIPASKDWTPTTGQFFFQKSKKKRGEMKRVYICLYKSYLVTSKNKEWYKKYKSVDLSKRFLTYKRFGSTSDCPLEGFSLSYNSKQIELYSKTPEEMNTFIYHLKKYVVQNNFDVRYQTHEKLGAGSYAEVYKIEDKVTHSKYAAKIFRPFALKNSQSSKAVVMNEVIMQRQLDHPHIVKLYEIYECDEKVIIVIEYAEGRRMLDYVMDHAPLTEKKCVLLMKQLLEATIYIHSLGIIHRDIKLENTIIMGEKEGADALSLKMLDFGLAVHVDNVGFLKKSGTPGYVAPEVFIDDRYGTKIDVFSLGVILYTVLSGKSPFVGPDRRSVLNLNKKCEFSLRGRHWMKQSVNAKDLVKKMMEPDPSKRYDAQKALEHPWFTLVYLNGVQPVVNLPKVMKMSNVHIFASRPPSPTPSALSSSIAHSIEPLKKTGSERTLLDIKGKGADRRKSTLDTNRSQSTRNTGKQGQYLNQNFLKIPGQVLNGVPNSQVLLTSVAFDEKMDLSSYDDAINRSSIKTFYKALSSANSPKVSSGLNSASSSIEGSPPKRQKSSPENSFVDHEIARENPEVKDKLSLYAFDGNRKPSVFVDSRSHAMMTLEDIPEAREDKQTCEVTITCEEDSKSSRGYLLAVAQTPKCEDVYMAFSPYLKSPRKPKKRVYADL